MWTHSLHFFIYFTLKTDLTDGVLFSRIFPSPMSTWTHTCTEPSRQLMWLRSMLESTITMMLVVKAVRGLMVLVAVQLICNMMKISDARCMCMRRSLVHCRRRYISRWACFIILFTIFWKSPRFLPYGQTGNELSFWSTNDFPVSSCLKLAQICRWIFMTAFE